MKQLSVYCKGVRAGVLIEKYPGRDYSFKYDEDYLKSSLPAISLTLPKREEAYESEILFPFFTNLLPEGSNKRYICRKNKIDEEDYFGLLSIMANADFIGAVDVRRIENE